ncbi:MAG: proteasome assembly chaperone family protein [Candidatus Diapherotrites archaeon]|nr:proteasome assembly chaperone family protein [Candidatus Diapherotrites archaeon]
MMETEVIIEREIRLDKPILIEGLPGLGLVGKIAAEHMLTELNAERFGTLYSPHFPPQVIIEDDGVVRMMRNEFYYWTAENENQHDLIFIVGDHQGQTPDSHYELVGKILDVSQMYNTKMIYTLGGYGTGRLPRHPKVFGAVNDKSLIKPLKEAGVSFEKTGGAIVGAAGLLLGQGKLRGIKGACLMGETHGQIIDARSAKAVLEILCKLLNLSIDLTKLEKKAKETEKMLEKAMKAEQQQQQIMKPLPIGEGPTYIR